MKLTKSKQQYVKNKVIEYCKSMKCDVPNWLFLTASEWNEFKAYVKETRFAGRKRNLKDPNKYWGLCWKEYKAIGIFVKKHPSLKWLDNTIRHELVHWVRRYNHRSMAFAKNMNQLKMGTLVA